MPVMVYWMPMTLWSTEKTYARQKPSASSWAPCAACGWGTATAPG